MVVTMYATDGWRVRSSPRLSKAATSRHSNGIQMIHGVLICKFRPKVPAHDISLIFSFEASQHFRSLATHEILHDSPKIATTLGREDFLANLSPVPGAV